MLVPITSLALTQHPFVMGISDKQPLRELVAKARAAAAAEEEDEEEGLVLLVCG